MHYTKQGAVAGYRRYNYIHEAILKRCIPVSLLSFGDYLHFYELFAIVYYRQNILFLITGLMRVVGDDDDEIPFFDVLVKNEKGKIETDIFYKETDSRQYLLFYPCHPRHTKVNIPYNLARRIRTIVSDETTLNHRMQKLKCSMNKQKYPELVIDYGVKRAMALDKNDLRKVKPKPTENIIPFVSTHNPKDPKMFNVTSGKHVREMYVVITR